MVSLAVGGTFEPPQPCPVRVGMLIGHPYRIKVVGIPMNQGLEVFPTIEVIDRLHPPLGQEASFPIPIQLTREELEMAMSGGYVVRVIYLEDPATALPLREDPNEQRYFEAAADQDPLKAADELGRPMAILRMGSRIPDATPANEAFLYGTPPLVRYETTAVPSNGAPVESANLRGVRSSHPVISNSSPGGQRPAEAWRPRAAQSP